MLLQVLFPKLEALELSSIDSEEIKENQHQARSFCILTSIQTKSGFQNLLSMKVQGFGSLKYLLSSSTARLMVQLKYLYIEDCRVMEDVILTEDLGEEHISGVLFSRLEVLRLKDLPILKRFCIGSNIKFPSLEDLRIEQCPKLKSFIFKHVSSEEITHSAMQPLFNEEVNLF